MLLRELLAGVDVVAVHAPLDMEIPAVCHSSRDVTPGAMFVAIAGYAADGHNYIPAAVEAGAGVVVCEWKQPKDAPWIQCATAAAPWRALARTGTAARPRA